MRADVSGLRMGRFRAIGIAVVGGFLVVPLGGFVQASTTGAMAGGSVKQSSSVATGTHTKADTKVRGWSTRSTRVKPYSVKFDRVRIASKVRQRRRVLVQRRALGKRWRIIQRGNTTRVGKFRAKLVVPRSGRWEFRISVRATHRARRAVTQVRRLVVRRPRLSATQQRLVAAINNARSRGRRCGATYYRARPPLRVSSALAASATSHARSMARRNYFSHDGGSTPTSRARSRGYHGAIAENIAAGVSSVDRAMKLWLNSAPHCANLMSANYRDVGVGHAYASSSRWGHYWVQVFGRR